MSCALSRQETAGAAGDTAKSWMENSEPLQLAGKGRAFFKKKNICGPAIGLAGKGAYHRDC